MTPIVTENHIKNSSGLDTDQGEGIKNKLKFSAKQLSDRIHLCASQVSDEYNELPSPINMIKISEPKS